MSIRFFRFGPFQINVQEQVLLREGRPLPLKPKLFELLLVLVAKSGHVLSKDQLMKQVWADSFVEEGNLAVSVHEIRKTLGGDSNGQPYIETIPRRGYRFAPCVTEITEEDEVSERAAVKASLTPGPGTSIGDSRGTIAVLPFKSIGASSNEFLGLGMTDALITRLSNLRQVMVRPTTSVRKYSGSHDPVVAGKELSVEWVLDGSIQKSGKRIRLTVQLVHVGDGVLRWAEKFDEKFTNIFAVEDSISEQVIKELEPRLTGTERRLLTKRHTENPVAYESYLKGRYFWEKRTIKGCQRGIEYFENAITNDAHFALAYAGLGHCYLTLGGYKVLSRFDYYAKAEEAILRALEIDEELAEAHSSLGSLKIRQWDWSGAQREFERSIRLNPNHVIAHVGYASYLSLIGRTDEALLAIDRALRIDPLSLPAHSAKGSILYVARKYDETIDQFKKTLILDEEFGVAHFCLGIVYDTLGRYEEARTMYLRSRRRLGNIPELCGTLARIDALTGKTAESIAAINDLKRISGQNYIPFYCIALIYCALGDDDAAFQALESGYSEHDEDLFLIKVDPRLDCLRADPRFFDLLKRVGFID
ncbi:MAG TPA: winged helix-turn-helix domain-containing protein [Blastocatellia bacterium]|nr:winged helix-turn-helix domain-containing protein [Blastocatellia bacterium]